MSIIGNIGGFGGGFKLPENLDLTTIPQSGIPTTTPKPVAAATTTPKPVAAATPTPKPAGTTSLPGGGSKPFTSAQVTAAQEAFFGSSGFGPNNPYPITTLPNQTGTVSIPIFPEGSAAAANQELQNFISSQQNPTPIQGPTSAAGEALPGSVTSATGVPSPDQVDHSNLGSAHWDGKDLSKHPRTPAYLPSNFFNGMSPTQQAQWLSTYNNSFGTGFILAAGNNSILTPYTDYSGVPGLQPGQADVSSSGGAAGNIGFGGAVLTNIQSGQNPDGSFNHAGVGTIGSHGIGNIGHIGGGSAPTMNLDKKPSNPNVRQLTAQQLNSGLINSDSPVYQMQDVGDASGSLASPVDAAPNVAQAATTAQAASAIPTTATTYTADTGTPAATLTAADGTVSPDSVASVAEQQLSQLAVAASRNISDEMASLASTPSFTLSQESEVAAAIDSQPVEAQAAIADLPQEALVTNQLETLLEDLETGDIPSWALPAVTRVNEYLAERGMEVSDVAQQDLFSAIVQSAIPLAQSNATALQQRASQNLNNQQQVNIANAEFEQGLKIANLTNRQQAALQNAALQGNLDLAMFSAEQQTALSNSQFAQTMTLTDFNARQQATIQNATSLASLDLANLDTRTRLAAQNAQSFLQMDLANLSNEQQSRVINQQSAQQSLLSDQAATNAARQFNAASQTQVDQFMTQLSASIEEFNAAQRNAMEQFNVAEENRLIGQDALNATQVGLANAQILTQVSQFNATLDQQREQFNVTNQQAISQADIAWRRQANTIDTAAINTANQQNVQNAFQMTYLEQQQLWQQLRDEAAYIRDSYENDQTRRTSLYAAALGNETATGEGSTTSSGALLQAVSTLLG